MHIYLIIHNFKNPPTTLGLNSVILKLYDSCCQLTSNSLLLVSNKTKEDIFEEIFKDPFFIKYTQNYSYDTSDLDIYIDNKNLHYEDNLLFVTEITNEFESNYGKEILEWISIQMIKLSNFQVQE